MNYSIFDLITGGIEKEKWDWKKVSSKASIETIESLIEYDKEIIKLLDWNYVSGNPTLTLEFIDSHLSYHWNYRVITANKNLILAASFIEKYINYPWDWSEISTWTYTGRILKIVPEEQENKTTLVIKYSQDQWKALLEKYPHIEGWDWNKLSNSHSLEFIFSHKEWPWNWYLVCRNKNVYNEKIWDYIRENPALPWDWKGLTHIENSEVPHDILLFEEETFYFNKWERADMPSKKYRDFDWEYLSAENRISLDIVDRIPDVSWDWKSLSSHEDLTVEFILKYKDKPWCFDTFLVRKF